MKKTFVVLAVFVIISVFIVGCSEISVRDIKSDPEDYVGKVVTLKGISKNAIKIGSLSGFTLEQEDGSTIQVSSKELPKDDSVVVVKGTVVNDAVFKTYILASKIKY